MICIEFDRKCVTEKADTQSHILCHKTTVFFSYIGSVRNTWKTRAKLVLAWHKIKNYNFRHIGSFVSVTLVTWNACNEYIFNRKLQEKRGWLHKYARLLALWYVSLRNKKRYEMTGKRVQTISNEFERFEWVKWKQMTNKKMLPSIHKVRREERIKIILWKRCLIDFEWKLQAVTLRLNAMTTNTCDDDDDDVMSGIKLSSFSILRINYNKIL